MHRAFVVLNPHQIVSFFYSVDQISLSLMQHHKNKFIVLRVSIMVCKVSRCRRPGFSFVFANLVFTLIQGTDKISNSLHKP
jgi:hypothetical protein